MYRLLHSKRLELTWDIVLSVLLDAAKGVAYLHQSKPTIIHRDLKSHNILINEHWRAKICDFGLSRIVEKQRTLTACGTPCWTAPEVLRNQRYTAKADVYSFGIVLWESITRRDPFGHLAPFQVIFAVATQGARPPVPVDCPAEAAALMRACWHENAAERPSFSQIIDSITDLQILIGDGNEGGGARDPPEVHEVFGSPMPEASLEKVRRALNGTASATEENNNNENTYTENDEEEGGGAGGGGALSVQNYSQGNSVRQIHGSGNRKFVSSHQ